MPFLELTLHYTQSDHPRIEAALDEFGALSVTLMDADTATPVRTMWIARLNTPPRDRRR